MSVAEPTFVPGQKVRAVASVGWSLTEGKEYTVVEVTPPCYHPHARFTFPVYVTVLNDQGKPRQWHTHRFQPVEEKQ
jgi:hypothetical protein